MYLICSSIWMSLIIGKVFKVDYNKVIVIELEMLFLNFHRTDMSCRSSTIVWLWYFCSALTSLNALWEHGSARELAHKACMALRGLRASYPRENHFWWESHTAIWGPGSPLNVDKINKTEECIFHDQKLSSSSLCKSWKACIMHIDIHLTAF